MRLLLGLVIVTGGGVLTSAQIERSDIEIRGCLADSRNEADLGLATPEDYARFATWCMERGYPAFKLHTWQPPYEGAPDPNGSGAVRVFGNGPVKVFEEIRDFEPPKRMSYSVVKGGLPMKNHLGEVVFEPDGDGTLVSWRCRFDSRIPGLGGLMRGVVTRVFRQALEGLSRHSFPGGVSSPSR